MVPPPSWTALESSGLGRSASLSAGPRIQQVNEAAWPLPGWACANVNVAISRMLRMSCLPKLLEQEKYPSGAQPAQPPLRRARVCLESLGTTEPDGVLEERPRRRAVVDAKPRPHAQECVDRETTRRARRPTGRQHVIRSRAVVAQDFRGSRTDEQRAVMAQPGRHGGRVPELELQVLRCNRVARRDPFV